MHDRIAAGCLLGLVGLVVAATPVAASGGISCEAHDTAIRLDLLADVARAIGANVSSPQGEFQVKDKAGRWQAVVLAGGLVQSWIEGREAKLQFYMEETTLNGGDSVELVISTLRVGKSDQFKGSYVLRVYEQDADAKVLTQHGEADCSLD